MRPQAGWGTVAQLMDPSYQARAFYGGPTGPNYPSPRGLLDIPNWQTLDPGAAAQAVEVSAYPARYQNYQPVAETILTALTQPTQGGSDSESTSPVVPETTRIVFPLPEGTWVRTSAFGSRIDPVTGAQAHHNGSDFSAPDGTAILAVADGLVVFAAASGSYGNLIIIEHTVGGQRVASWYAHMWDHGIHVAAGQSVTAGQHIADVGSKGKSTGAHLHLEIHPGGRDGAAVDADEWLTGHNAEGIDGGTIARPLCTGTGGA
jgi:murein DD-endopeptidase MepM/ murein hydrolase activator NlpD